MADILSRIKLRRGPAAQASSINPVLLQGEAGFTTDTQLLKIGDGVTPWNSLRTFLSIPASAIIAAQAFLNATSAASQRQVLGLAGGATTDLTGLPFFTFESSPPVGSIKANGAALSRVTYANLFAKIGTKFGIGDGVTTFNVPDLRGEILRGWDDGRGVDPGRLIGSFQAAAMLDHSHSGVTSSDGVHSHTPPSNNFMTSAGPVAFGGSGGNMGITNATLAAPPHTHSFTTGSPSVGGGSETRMRNVAALGCIWY